MFLQKLFFGLSLLGAEWVLYVLVLLSIISVAIMFERIRFYQVATKGAAEFRAGIRKAVQDANWQYALKLAQDHSHILDGKMAAAVLVHHHSSHKNRNRADVLTEIAQDAVLSARLSWESRLAVLATVGNNAPFIGLFGTVLGIIKAFHDLSSQTSGSPQMVTAGISEALVATAVGILVAIPAVIAFNAFSRKVKAALTEAEALKSFLVGKLAGE